MNELNVKEVFKYQLPFKYRIYLLDSDTKIGITFWHLVGNLICDSVEDYQKHMSQFKPTQYSKNKTLEHLEQIRLQLTIEVSEWDKIPLGVAYEQNLAVENLIDSLYSKIEKNPFLLLQGK